MNRGPLALPYRFDTTAVVVLILRGVLGLLLVVLAGMVYSVLISHDLVAAIQLLLIASIVVYFGYLFLRNLRGARGTITADAVEVELTRLYGVRLAGPSGRFPLQSFRGIKVERIPPLVWHPGGPHERVSLAGKEGTPDILIARTDDDAGRALGGNLALALGLPYQEESAPY